MMMTLGGWSGRIPRTYAQATEEERAVAVGLAMLRNRK
jgi:hypothetical protein